MIRGSEIGSDHYLPTDNDFGGTRRSRKGKKKMKCRRLKLSEIRLLYQEKVDIKLEKRESNETIENEWKRVNFKSSKRELWCDKNQRYKRDKLLER